MQLSALDLSPILAGETASEALAHSIALAEHAERIGLRRLWLAEHHNIAALACPCPELLIARLGAATETLRLGAGGIMLPNHSPLKVAETFRVLEALYPGRIDLGLGRAPGTDPRTAAELRRGAHVTGDDFPAQLDALLAFQAPDDLPREPFSGTTLAIPANVPAPEVFLLSSSGYGAELAARRGLGLAFAHHMNPRDTTAALRRYRETFQPSSHRDEPYAIASVSVVCAEATADARHLAGSTELAMLRLAQGRRDLPLATAEEAAAFDWDGEAKAIRRMFGMAPVVGAIDEVATKLTTLADESGADELMLLTMVHDQQARRRSYALVADVLNTA